VAILQWTAEQFGRRRASIYRETLIDALSALSADPFVTDSHARDEIRPGLRTIHVARHGRRGRHFVLYRISGRGTIDILRILHDSMDIGLHVPDDTGS
jgi:toxin ParE1/3/4